jgi:hypothetical protein
MTAIAVVTVAANGIGVSPRGTRGDSNIANPGAAHLAVAVEDLDAEYTRLKAWGVRPSPSPA